MWPWHLSLPEDLSSGEWLCNRACDVCQMNNLTGHLASLRGWEMEMPMSSVLEPGAEGEASFPWGPGREEGRHLLSQIIKRAVSFPAPLHILGSILAGARFFPGRPVTSVGPRFPPVLLTLLAGWLSQACGTSGGLGV